MDPGCIRVGITENKGNGDRGLFDGQEKCGDRGPCSLSWLGGNERRVAEGPGFKAWKEDSNDSRWRSVWHRSDRERERESSKGLADGRSSTLVLSGVEQF